MSFTYNDWVGVPPQSPRVGSSVDVKKECDIDWTSMFDSAASNTYHPDDPYSYTYPMTHSHTSHSMFGNAVWSPETMLPSEYHYETNYYPSDITDEAYSPNHEQAQSPPNQTSPTVGNSTQPQCRMPAPTTTRDRSKNMAKTRCSRPHECHYEDCALKFARSHNLKCHIDTIHLNKRPFVCSEPGCAEAFARKHDLKRHFQSKHTDLGSPRKKVKEEDKPTRK